MAWQGQHILTSYWVMGMSNSNKLFNKYFIGKTIPLGILRRLWQKKKKYWHGCSWWLLNNEEKVIEIENLYPFLSLSLFLFAGLLI